MKWLKNRRAMINTVLVLVVVVGIMTVGTFMAKYIHRESVKGNVTLSMDLIEGLQLVENKAEIQSDGSYKLGEELVAGNTYTFLPGVDVPKNPHFVLTSKSEVDAYLYVEVVDGVHEGINWDVDLEHWIILPEAQGNHGGVVYVYSQDGTSPAVINKAFSISKIGILKDNKLDVSKNVVLNEGFSLDFYGYMAQKIEDKTPAQIYNICFPIS